MKGIQVDPLCVELLSIRTLYTSNGPMSDLTSKSNVSHEVYAAAHLRQVRHPQAQHLPAHQQEAPQAAAPAPILQPQSGHAPSRHDLINPLFNCVYVSTCIRGGV